MSFIKFLIEIDDIGTPVQGLGGSIAGQVPMVLPQGTLKEIIAKLKKSKTSKKNESAKRSSSKRRKQ